MLSSHFLLVLLTINAVNGFIQVPFVGIYENPIQFNLSIGTPPQKVELDLRYVFYEPALYVPDKNTFGVGFDAKSSSTYIESNNITKTEWHSVNGTDTFDMNGSIVKEKPFQVLSDEFTIKMKRGFMDIHRHETDCQLKDKAPCTNFITSVLRDFDDQVLNLVFDKIETKKKAQFTGQLIFGSKAPQLCDSNWAFMPEVKSDFEQWTFNLDKVSIGKYTQISTIKCTIMLDRSQFVLPKNLVKNILKTLGSLDSKHIPCDQTNDLVFTLGGQEIRIPPELYLKEKKSGLCEFNAWPDEDQECRLPIYIFSEHCFLFDYKNIQVGFSKRINS